VRRIAAAIAVCAATLAAAADDKPLHAKIEAQQVSPHAWFVQGGTGVASAQNEGFNSNAGFVVTPEGVVVIDALGTPALGEELLEAIRRVTPQPVKRLILTHYHADHFYGAAAFKSAGAEVWAHEAAREYLTSGEAERRREQRAQDLFPWVAPDMPIVKPDRYLGAHTAFELGGVCFEVDHMGPAHSPEDVIVVLPGEGVIFAGDILFAGRIPFVGDADSRAWLGRIDALLAMKPRVMVTGHGAISRDPARDLALTRDYLRYLRETMGRAAEELTPFDEAYAKTDWSRFSRLPAFEAANRINAYGTYLLMERELLKR
jgi:glyoxylase-like metal-dependent hydrolase (beta-lactamase superfamily II)